MKTQLKKKIRNPNPIPLISVRLEQVPTLAENNIHITPNTILLKNLLHKANFNLTRQQEHLTFILLLGCAFTATFLLLFLCTLLLSLLHQPGFWASLTLIHTSPTSRLPFSSPGHTELPTSHNLAQRGEGSLLTSLPPPMPQPCLS